MNHTHYDVVVVGGGVAGMEVAYSLSQMNIKVLLIEKKSTLGGNVATLACMATKKCGKCSACLAKEYIAKISYNSNIDIMMHTRITKVKEENNLKTIYLSPEYGNGNGAMHQQLKEETSVQTEIVALATGFQPFNAKDDRLLGYGHFRQVITTKDLNDLLKKDTNLKLISEKENFRIAFIQCVGSRDKQKGHNYCSQYCCATSMRLVQRLKHLCNSIEICVYYIDLQIMGKEFRTYYEQTKNFTTFKQGVPVEIKAGTNDETVRLVGVNEETGLGEEEEYDMVVLAIGIVPDKRNQKLFKMFGLENNESGFINNNIDELAKRGLFVAGTCSGPADIQTSILRASACAGQIARKLYSQNLGISNTAEIGA